MSTSTPGARPAATGPIDLEYPDRDGKPMSDNMLQFKWIVTIKEGLDALFRDDPNVLVAGDLLWYPVLGSPKIRSAPDAMVVFGRPKGYRGSYRQWEEAGIAPQVVFEVLSPGNTKREMRRKRAFYDQYGVEEYYVYDPDHGPLEGWIRGEGGLKPIEKIDGLVSPRLGVSFHPGAGPDNLAIITHDGRSLETYVELYRDREAERRRADAADRRADEALARAEAGLQRADAADLRAEAERRRAEEADLRAEAERRRAEEALNLAKNLADRLRALGLDDV
jgi:Uma2 family endonuclease